MLLIFSILCITTINCVIYESHSGEQISDERLSYFFEKNLTSICTNNVKPCGNGEEWRRIDGSCNNLQFPSRGALHTPQIRVVPADFGEDFEPRLTSTGEEMKPGRVLKNKLLEVGRGSSNFFTQAMGYFLEFSIIDIVSIHDAINYVSQTQYCCKEEGKNDNMCVPQTIPKDDPLNKFSGHTCMNLTRPLTFQNLGCTDKTTVPDRIDYATPFYDLSNIYQFLDGVERTIRSYEGGLLKTDVVNDREFASDGGSVCTLRRAIETACIRDVPNLLLGSSLFATYFWRLHNYFARQLAEINSCWDDELLFQCARDITIAFYQQMVFYEVFPHLLGAQYLLDLDIIQNGTGHRDLYDETVEPRMSIEYGYILRWFHITQNAEQKLFDKDCSYIKEIPIVNFSLRVQDLTIGDIFKQLTFGIHLQSSGTFDYTVHPHMTSYAFGPQQEMFDVYTADLVKGRYFGLPSYTKYRDYCTGYEKIHTTYDDIADNIRSERLESLKDSYPCASDIELMAGLWSEVMMEGAFVPPTMHCLMLEQLQRTVITDRYFFERPNRPHAFSYDQLQEIRKATLARLLCLVEEDLCYIQRDAFLVVGEGNELLTCDEIPDLDLSLWTDASCAGAE